MFVRFSMTNRVVIAVQFPENPHRTSGTQKHKHKPEMSASTDSNTTAVVAPIRGGPFPIVVLNRIFSFGAANAKDAVLQLGRVCHQWRETEMVFCVEMW